MGVAGLPETDQKIARDATERVVLGLLDLPYVGQAVVKKDGVINRGQKAILDVATVGSVVSVCMSSSMVLQEGERRADVIWDLSVTAGLHGSALASGGRVPNTRPLRLRWARKSSGVKSTPAVPRSEISPTPICPSAWKIWLPGPDSNQRPSG